MYQPDNLSENYDPANQSDEPPVPVRSLKELIDLVTGKSLAESLPQEDAGLEEPLAFPFLAIVGQPEMKLGLLLNLINPAIGGLLLIGPRGTGKTTAIRSIRELAPDTDHSTCYYGCRPEDIETGGMDAVCPSCAKKYAEGIPFTRTDKVKLIELPLNALLEDVIGSIEESPNLPTRQRLKRGILSHADKNILFIDEVNLLDDAIVNSILDACASGSYTVRRKSVSSTYRSRFTLIGSMNPEEGSLRPQILDRFGLRIPVVGLTDPEQRQLAYQRAMQYQKNPRGFISLFQKETTSTGLEIRRAQELLTRVSIPESLFKIGIELIQKLQIDSLRAEITLFEAARAHAAADGRTEIELKDLQIVSPMALRMRSSIFMHEYTITCRKESNHISSLLNPAE